MARTSRVHKSRLNGTCNLEYDKHARALAPAITNIILAEINDAGLALARARCGLDDLLRATRAPDARALNVRYRRWIVEELARLAAELSTLQHGLTSDEDN